MESDDTSRTLGAPPSDYLTVTPVTSPEAASLPPVSEYLSIPPDFSASGSDYLSITSNTPPTFPSTAPASDYLTVTPVSPTQPESAPFYPSPSDYLTVTPVTPPQVASSAPASDYLTITPVSPSQGESAPFYPSPSDYLTVTRVSPSEVASSDYLSVSPIAVTQVTAVESNYLPVTPSIQQTPHVTDYLPISPDIFTPTEPASDFLPVPSGYMPISSTDQDESVLPYIIIPSAYLPVKTKSPSPSDPVVLPIVPSPGKSSNLAEGPLVMYVPVCLGHANAETNAPSSFLSLVSASSMIFFDWESPQTIPSHDLTFPLRYPRSHSRGCTSFRYHGIGK